MTCLEICHISASDVPDWVFYLKHGMQRTVVSVILEVCMCDKKCLTPELNLQNGQGNVEEKKQ